MKTEERGAGQVAQAAEREFLRAAMMKHFSDKLSMDEIGNLIYDVYPAPSTPAAPTCPKCHGERVVRTKAAGEGHSDDLAEYEPCECASTPAAPDGRAFQPKGIGPRGWAIPR
jgi:hypothetical protein